MKVQEQRRREVHAWHTHVGRGAGENTPLVSESMAAGPCPYLSETAVRRLKFEKHLGKGAFGDVIQVVSTMDGSRHAVKLAKNVSRTMSLRFLK